MPVEHHDDNSQPSMYDFRVVLFESPTIAIECVRAVDALATETWKVGPAKSPFEWGHLLKGDWH